MDHIPVEFEHEGKIYKGHLSQVARAGGTSAYHLQDSQSYYLGRLRQANEKWFFDATPKSKGLESLADFFADYITAWYEQTQMQIC